MFPVNLIKEQRIFEAFDTRLFFYFMTCLHFIPVFYKVDFYEKLVLLFLYFQPSETKLFRTKLRDINFSIKMKMSIFSHKRTQFLEWVLNQIMEHLTSILFKKYSLQSVPFQFCSPKLVDIYQPKYSEERRQTIKLLSVSIHELIIMAYLRNFIVTFVKLHINYYRVSILILIGEVTLTHNIKLWLKLFFHRDIFPSRQGPKNHVRNNPHTVKSTTKSLHSKTNTSRHCMLKRNLQGGFKTVSKA